MDRSVSAHEILIEYRAVAETVPNHTSSQRPPAALDQAFAASALLCGTTYQVSFCSLETSLPADPCLATSDRLHQICIETPLLAIAQAVHVDLLKMSSWFVPHTLTHDDSCELAKLL
jgi:hypothetical protein